MSSSTALSSEESEELFEGQTQEEVAKFLKRRAEQCMTEGAQDLGKTYFARQGEVLANGDDDIFCLDDCHFTRSVYGGVVDDLNDFLDHNITDINIVPQFIKDSAKREEKRKNGKRKKKKKNDKKSKSNNSQNRNNSKFRSESRMRAKSEKGIKSEKGKKRKRDELTDDSSDEIQILPPPSKKAKQSEPTKAEKLMRSLKRTAERKAIHLLGAKDYGLMIIHALRQQNIPGSRPNGLLLYQAQAGLCAISNQQQKTLTAPPTSSLFSFNGAHRKILVHVGEGFEVKSEFESEMSSILELLESDLRIKEAAENVAAEKKYTFGHSKNRCNVNRNSNSHKNSNTMSTAESDEAESDDNEFAISSGSNDANHLAQILLNLKAMSTNNCSAECVAFQQFDVDSLKGLGCCEQLKKLMNFVLEMSGMTESDKVEAD